LYFKGPNLFKAKAFSINLPAAVSVPAGNTAKQPQRILFIYIELAGAKVSKESWVKDAGRRTKDPGTRDPPHAFHVDFICDNQPRVNKHKHIPIPHSPNPWHSYTQAKKLNFTCIFNIYQAAAAQQQQ